MKQLSHRCPSNRSTIYIVVATAFLITVSLPALGQIAGAGYDAFQTVPARPWI